MLTIIEAMKDKTTLRKDLVDPLVDREKWRQEERQEKLEVLRENMEDRLGDRVLKTLLEDWDEQEDYNQRSGCQLKGPRFGTQKRHERQPSAGTSRAGKGTPRKLTKKREPWRIREAQKKINERGMCLTKTGERQK